MTIIATDGKSMAGDGRTSFSNTIASDQTQKVHRLTDGRIFGCCGAHHDTVAFRAWMLGGGDFPKLDDGFQALILNPDGTVDWCDKDNVLTTYPVPMAIGSGMDFALGAMDAGCTPEQAVVITCGRDKNCGGSIVVEYLSLARMAA